MDWVLLWWIVGCSGLGCEVPDYQLKEYRTEQECHDALDIVMQLSPKAKVRTSTLNGTKKTTYDYKGTHRGICVSGMDAEFLKDVKRQLSEQR